VYYKSVTIKRQGFLDGQSKGGEGGFARFSQGKSPMR
jgi:hypothetical protein